MKPKRKYTVKQYPDGGGPNSPTNNTVDKPKGNLYQQYYNEYLSSPEYKARLKATGYVNVDQVIKDRLANVNSASIKNVKDWKSNSGEAMSPFVFIDGRQDPSYDSIAAHEYGHRVGAALENLNPNLNLSDAEQLQLIRRNREQKNKKDDHLRDPGEAKADLDALRYQMNLRGINKPNLQANQTMLDAIKNDKDLKNTLIYQRLQKRYKDEDLLWLLNNLAKTDNIQNTTTMAKYGGKYKISPKFPDGGKPKPKPPIIVTNPNDPRLKAYNDSMALYNTSPYTNKAANDPMTVRLPPEEKKLYNAQDFFDVFHKVNKAANIIKPVAISMGDAGILYYQKPTGQPPIKNNTKTLPNVTAQGKPTYQDSLNLYNAGKKYYIDEFSKPFPDYYPANAKPYLNKYSEYYKLGDDLNLKDRHYPPKLEKIAREAKKLGINPIGYYPVEGQTLAFKKPVGSPEVLANPENYKAHGNIQITSPQQEMMPIQKQAAPQGQIMYGPANSAIGYMTVDGKFTPIERTDHLNKADKELLNNPEALQKYITMTPRYKFGGKKYDVGGQNLPTFEEWLQQTGQPMGADVGNNQWQQYQDFLSTFNQSGQATNPINNKSGQYSTTIKKEQQPLQYSNGFKALNTTLDLTTLIASKVNDIKNAREEKRKYLNAAYPQPQTNHYEQGDNSPLVFKNGGLSAEKAAIMLHDNRANGKPLTRQQQKYFGWVAGGSKQYGGEEFCMGGQFDKYAAGGEHWIQGAVNPAHKGYCTPMTKETCTPARKAFAMTMKKHHGFHKMADGGEGDTSELEQGEHVQQTDGNISKISDSAPRHEQGGVDVPFVFRVLEDTSDKRKDSSSKALRVSPDEALAITGIKTTKDLTHSKLYEKSTEFYANQLKKVQKDLKDAVEYSNLSRDKYNMNTIDENTRTLSNIPTDAMLFDKIFNHQETVKQKYGIMNDSSVKHKFGGSYANGGDGDPIYKTPNGYYTKQALKSGFNLTDKEIDDYAKSGFYTSLDRSQIPQGQSLNDDFAVSGSEPFTPPLQNSVQAIAPTDRATNTGNIPTLNHEDASYGAYSPSASHTVNFPGKTVVQTKAPSGVGAIGYNSNSQITKSTSTGNKDFNVPLSFEDTATDFLGLLENGRTPVGLEQLDRPDLKYREQSPLPIIQQGQEDYNSIVSSLPQDTLGFANRANIFGKKYALNNQVLGQYTNINKQGQMSIDAQNNLNRFQLDQLNASARDTQQQRILQGENVQQENKLNLFGDLMTRISLNKKLNREGDLTLQTTPYFDQTGRYNGNVFPINPSTGQRQKPTGYKRQMNPQTGKYDLIPVFG